MVSLRFSSFMIVMVLFIFLTIKDTIAHNDDQVKQMVHQAENANTRALRNHLSVLEKEVLDGVPAVAEFGNGKTGGRKMMIERKKDMKQVEKTDSSGNYHRPGYSRKNVHSQLNFKIQGDERDSTNSASTGSFQKVESKKRLDDATEFFTMMNKDYVGGPGSGSKPHHKPPINNFQPLHTSNP